MKAFNNVRKQCFGMVLDPVYQNSIREFALLWLKCDRSITLKCHVLFVHVVQFLNFAKDAYPGKGLGFWAEQASESVHKKWEEFWLHRKRPITDPDYERVLFDSLCAFNARHYGNEND